MTWTEHLVVGESYNLYFVELHKETWMTMQTSEWFWEMIRLRIKCLQHWANSMKLVTVKIPKKKIAFLSLAKWLEVRKQLGSNPA